jgi:hypothetical protein
MTASASRPPSALIISIDLRSQSGTPKIRAEFHMSAAAHGNHGFGYMQVIAGEGAVESEQ